MFYSREHEQLARICVVFLLAGGGGLVGANPRECILHPAEQYVVHAFDRYPLVAVSEWHDSLETMQFMHALIRYSGFVDKVTDIVVEFGNARYQSLVDRYLGGENVTRPQLQQVWENTTQTSDVWSSPIYEEFFADVRALNETLPPKKRLRVLLGDPPIDWSHVNSPADEDMNDWRDAHFAWVVKQAIMNQGRKALLFVGGAHISRRVIFPNSLIHLLDAMYPNKTLVIKAIQVPMTKNDIASRMRNWPAPSVVPLRDTWLGVAAVQDVGFPLSKGEMQDDADDVLFLGAGRFSSVPAQIDPHSPYGLELKRRQRFEDETQSFRGGKIRFQAGSTVCTAEANQALKKVVAELQQD